MDSKTLELAGFCTDAFYAWCENPAIADANTYWLVNAFAVLMAPALIKPVSVGNAAEAAQSLADNSQTHSDVRRFALLSREAWWQRELKQGGHFVDEPPAEVAKFAPYMGAELLSVRTHHLGNGESVRRLTYAVGEQTADTYAFQKYGVTFSLQAVIEQWCEPGKRTENIAVFLEAQPAFQAALTMIRERGTGFVVHALQTYLMPVNPSVAQYALRRAQGDTQAQAQAQEPPRRGAHLLSFVISPDQVLDYGGVFTDETRWEVITRINCLPRFLTDTIQRKIDPVVLKHAAWVASLSVTEAVPKVSSGRPRRPIKEQNVVADIIAGKASLGDVVKKNVKATGGNSEDWNREVARLRSAVHDAKNATTKI